jgi:hypothetical protein
MDCPCGNPVPAGRRGQTRIYCSPTCRKAAEVGRRATRRVSEFQASVSDVADRAEILLLLSAAARRGSVSACRVLLEELRRDGGEPAVAPSVIDSIIDEVAAKRRKAEQRGS